MRKAFGDRLLIDNLNFNLPRGGIVGIIGPNGAGKTTLFRMLTGAEPADAGEIRIGPAVQLAYVDQSRQTLDDRKTVWEEISGGQDILRVNGYETPSRSYVGRFNFKGSAAAAAHRRALGRRAQPRAPCQGAARRRQRAAAR